jgi:hypothetical protein
MRLNFRSHPRSVNAKTLPLIVINSGKSEGRLDFRISVVDENIQQATPCPYKRENGSRRLINNDVDR